MLPTFDCKVLFHQTGRCFAKIPIFSLWENWENWKIQVSYPICSICPKNHPNVGKYTIHGAYGYDYQYPMFLCWCYCPSAKQEIFDQFDKESRCSWGSFDVLRWAFVYWLVVWNMFYFPFHTLDNPSHWLSYFSAGWKPPTSINRLVNVETKCVSHLRVPNELLQNMFIIECPRTWCAHAGFILQGCLLPNRVCPCAGVTFYG